MHTNIIFDELEIVQKLATRSRTSHEEIRRTNKNKGLHSMQMVELPKTM
jgi:hypothetical protein